MNSTRAVSTVTSKTCPPKSAMGSELLRVEASVSTGAMVTGVRSCSILDLEANAHHAIAMQTVMRDRKQVRAAWDQHVLF